MSTDLFCGSQVRLAALTREDLPTMVRWYHDPEFMRLYDADPAFPKTLEQLNQWLEEKRKSTNAFYFAVHRQLDEQMIGLIEIDDILWTHRTGWLGIAIGDRSLWGKGLGTEAMQLAIDYAFNELNLYRVQLTVFEYNPRAIALYQKLGFQHEGTFRQFLLRDGRRYDMLLFGLLRDEWERLKAETGEQKGGGKR